MKNYFIKTYREEESKRVMDVLHEYSIENIHRGKSVIAYESISFKCDKKMWKKVKSILNLEVVDVFSQIRVG